MGSEKTLGKRSSPHPKIVSHTGVWSTTGHLELSASPSWAQGYKETFAYFAGGGSGHFNLSYCRGCMASLGSTTWKHLNTKDVFSDELYLAHAVYILCLYVMDAKAQG